MVPNYVWSEYPEYPGSKLIVEPTPNINQIESLRDFVVAGKGDPRNREYRLSVQAADALMQQICDLERKVGDLRAELGANWSMWRHAMRNAEIQMGYIDKVMK